MCLARAPAARPEPAPRCQGTSGLPCGRTADLPVGGQVMSVPAVGWSPGSGSPEMTSILLAWVCLHRSRRHQPPEPPLGVGCRADSSAGDVRPSCRFR